MFLLVVLIENLIKLGEIMKMEMYDNDYKTKGSKI